MKKIILCLILCVPLFWMGCNGSSNLSGLASGEGVITLNGEALEDASITFSPLNAGSTARSAGAVSEKDGKFKIMTLNPGDGIYPGEYAVSIRKFILLGPEPTEEQIRASSDLGIELPDREMKSLIPDKYESIETSGIKITIPAGGDKKIEIALEGDVP